MFGKDKGGRLITDAYLRVQAPPATASEPPHGERCSSTNMLARCMDDRRALTAPLDGVFALGDCANVGGKNHPATAQVAEQQGNYLASM